jgi:katanin p60 ATPase-containing subunit A1
MVLATTNCPWDLDEAIRRRLEKRIYIPLPDFVARRDMFEKCLNSIGEVSSDITPSSLANLTAGYSGADIHLVCREAAMMPMRRLLMHYSPMELNRLKSDGQLEIPPVSSINVILLQVFIYLFILISLKVSGDDFDNAISNTKSSVSSECIYRYMEWDKQYGSK